MENPNIEKMLGFLSSIHCLSKYTLCLTLILQSVVPFALAKHTTTWRASGFVHFYPMLLGQFEPVQWPFVLHCFVVEMTIVKRCVVNHTLLKHSEALLPSPKFCSFFQHLCQLLVLGERTWLCRVCLCSYYWIQVLVLCCKNKKTIGLNSHYSLLHQPKCPEVRAVVGL